MKGSLVSFSYFTNSFQLQFFIFFLKFFFKFLIFSINFYSRNFFTAWFTTSLKSLALFSASAVEILICLKPSSVYRNVSLLKFRSSEKSYWYQVLRNLLKLLYIDIGFEHIKRCKSKLEGKKWVACEFSINCAKTSKV